MSKNWGLDLYIIQTEGLTKLGRSQHPQIRLREIQRGLPWSPCHLWAVFPRAGHLEAALHRTLAARYEKFAEWYKASPEQIVAVVASHIAALEAV